ncbi:uncharacterized protein LOC129738772 [Uranotaenia lowii]|uniref:uncharacterized protein LOC129738772 n=1 Tax=Uranotaenia lowii TaxID=190385 RepID=UPI0024794985|nr:uncharacterized protein LOC129738772 [Uranotaenia lowii]
MKFDVSRVFVDQVDDEMLAESQLGAYRFPLQVEESHQCQRMDGDDAKSRQNKNFQWFLLVDKGNIRKPAVLILFTVIRNIPVQAPEENCHMQSKNKCFEMK